jgi:pimeloyl-ACP methyl ester carboxylesterase
VTVHDRFVRVGGATLHVRQAGTGRPVLLINGLGAHTGMWGPVERALAGHRVISFDAPGTGQSPLSWIPPTIPMLAGMATELLDVLQISSTDVLGYSFGGAVAQELALRSPDRVERLILAATSPGWGGVAGRFSSMMLVTTPWRYYSRRNYERTIGTIAGGRARHDRDFIDRHGDERLRHPPNPLAYATQILAGTLWSSLSRLHQLSVPTLVVSGEDDPLTPAVNGVLLAARIPQATLFIVEGEGHLLLIDDRSEALTAIAAFLAGTPVGASADEQALARALEDSGQGAPPWGMLSAVYRKTHSPPPR